MLLVCQSGTSWLLPIPDIFDDFLVSLHELAKTCNFCSNDCLQKALRDQIIEGLLDGEIIQELLQEKNLTLDQAITKTRLVVVSFVGDSCVQLSH